MATEKHRITISLTADQYDVLRRVASLQGAPMSRVVVELVAEMVPVLERVAFTMEAAVRAREGVRESMRAAVSRAEESIVPHAEAVLRQYSLLDEELRGLVHAVDGVREAEAAAAGATAPAGGVAGGAFSEGESPRPVITGATKVQRRAKKGGAQGKQAGCTCTVTEWERQENRACPVHFPKGGA